MLGVDGAVGRPDRCEVGVTLVEELKEGDLFSGEATTGAEASAVGEFDTSRRLWLRPSRLRRLAVAEVGTLCVVGGRGEPLVLAGPSPDVLLFRPRKLRLLISKLRLPGDAAVTFFVIGGVVKGGSDGSSLLSASLQTDSLSRGFLVSERLRRLRALNIPGRFPLEGVDNSLRCAGVCFGDGDERLRKLRALNKPGRLIPLESVDISGACFGDGEVRLRKLLALNRPGRLPPLEGVEGMPLFRVSNVDFLLLILDDPERLLGIRWIVLLLTGGVSGAVAVVNTEASSLMLLS